jgi:hypothetical protein
MSSHTFCQQYFYPKDRFSYNGNNGSVIRRAEIDEGGADFYFDEHNYVVKMDNEFAPVSYTIRHIKIMNVNMMVKI